MSEYTFTPSMAKDRMIATTHVNSVLAEVIIADHIGRSDILDRTRDEYRVEDFGDEMRLYVLGRKDRRWRLLVNLQFEGDY